GGRSVGEWLAVARLLEAILGIHRAPHHRHGPAHECLRGLRGARLNDSAGHFISAPRRLVHPCLREPPGPHWAAWFLLATRAPDRHRWVEPCCEERQGR